MELATVKYVNFIVKNGIFSSVVNRIDKIICFYMRYRGTIGNTRIGNKFKHRPFGFDRWAQLILIQLNKGRTVLRGSV